MRSKIALAAVALACTTFTATASDLTETGLTFYAGSFEKPVLNIPNPDGTCLPFPAEAESLVGWSNVAQVTAYWSDDCSGPASGLGTLRTFTAGEYGSFRAQ
ncbi:hypothetical protein ACLEPN_09575 [Myxococcus sp. 1LA]